MYLFKKKRRPVSQIPVEKTLKDSFITLDEDTQKALCRKLKTGDLTVKDRLAASFYGIALYIAAQYAKARYEHREDLLSEALMGVAVALNNIHEMYDDDIRPFVMSKIQTRCASFFKSSDTSTITGSTRYRRALKGDHRIRRPITIDNSYFNRYFDKHADDQTYQNLVDELKEAAKTSRQRSIVMYMTQGYDKKEVAKLIGTSHETVRREIADLEFRFLSNRAKRIQEERDAQKLRKNENP